MHTEAYDAASVQTQGLSLWIISSTCTGSSLLHPNANVLSKVIPNGVHRAQTPICAEDVNLYEMNPQI